MTNFRELCNELLDELNYQTDWSIAEELKARASAALAQPEPEGPTDEELRQLYCELFSLQCSPASLGTAPVRFARAVLARWGK